MNDPIAQRIEDKAEVKGAKRESECAVTWGNCSDKEFRAFGKPSETPHICKGVRRHKAKLHVCEQCNTVGHPIQPSPYSKAGAQFRAIVIANGAMR